MIKLFKAGSFGYAIHLIELHRLRTKVFKEIMRWDVSVSHEQLEFDQFDTPDTVYVGVYNDDEKIVGCCRIISCDKPYMIQGVWPSYLNSIDIPPLKTSAELSRFAVLDGRKTRTSTSKNVSAITAKLFYAVTKYCMMSGMHEIYAMHDHRVERVVKKIGCTPIKVSDSIKIDGSPCRVGCYRTDQAMLDNLAFHLGEHHPEIDFAPGLFGEELKDPFFIHSTVNA